MKVATEPVKAVPSTAPLTLTPFIDRTSFTVIFAEGLLVAPPLSLTWTFKDSVPAEVYVCSPDTIKPPEPSDVIVPEVWLLSPQNIVAVKSLMSGFGFPSVNVATGPE